MKSNHRSNAHPSNGAQTSATGSQSISQAFVPSDPRHAVPIVQATPVDPGLRIEAVVLEAVMATLRIYIDQCGYPPTLAEISQVTDLSREQIPVLLHILQGQGRLLRSRFGWRATQQTSGNPLEAIYAYLLIYERLYGLAPTLDEMVEALHLSHSILQQYLQQLVAEGCLQRHKHQAQNVHKQAGHQRKDRLDNLRLCQVDAAMRTAMQATAKRLCASQTPIELSGASFVGKSLTGRSLTEKTLTDNPLKRIHPVAHGGISSKTSSTAENRSYHEYFTNREGVTHG